MDRLCGRTIPVWIHYLCQPYPVSNWFVIIGRWNVLIHFEFCGNQPVGYLLPFCVRAGEVARGPPVYSPCIQPSKHYEFQLAFSASNKG